MNTELKKHTPMMVVEVAFWSEKEFLYWEWTKEQFREKLQSTYINFPLYSNRDVLRQKIKDYWVLDSKDEISLEMRLSSLTMTQKTQVKEYISRMQKNIGRYPTQKEIESMIQKALWITQEEEHRKDFSSLERFKTSLVIKRQRIAKIITWTFLWFRRVW